MSDTVIRRRSWIERKIWRIQRSLWWFYKKEVLETIYSGLGEFRIIKLGDTFYLQARFSKFGFWSFVENYFLHDDDGTGPTCYVIMCRKHRETLGSSDVALIKHLIDKALRQKYIPRKFLTRLKGKSYIYGCFSEEMIKSRDRVRKAIKDE